MLPLRLSASGTPTRIIHSLSGELCSSLSVPPGRLVASSRSPAGAGRPGRPHSSGLLRGLAALAGRCRFPVGLGARRALLEPSMRLLGGWLLPLDLLRGLATLAGRCRALPASCGGWQHWPAAPGVFWLAWLGHRVAHFFRVLLSGGSPLSCNIRWGRVASTSCRSESSNISLVVL